MRYSRQELFLGKEAQELLSKKTAAVIGLGALGSLAGELLARTGVNLILVDRDIVDITNLQRQTLYNEDDVNRLKAIQAKEHLMKINSEINIEHYSIDLDSTNINGVKADIILDCTDNLETRFLLNEYCVKNKIPLVHAAAIKDIGTVMNIFNDACLRCVVKEASNLETCDTVGILNTTSSLVSSLQANEAIKILLNREYEKNLLRINLRDNTIDKIKINKNNDCPVCNGKYEYLNTRPKNTIKLCGNGYQIKGRHNLNDLKKRLNCKDLNECLVFENMTIFQDRAIIKAETKELARILYAKYIGS